MNSSLDRPRILRECAVDLIRASDLIEQDATLAALESGHRRIRNVISELADIAAVVDARLRRLRAAA